MTFTLNHVVAALNSHADALLRAYFDMTFSQFLFLLSLREGRLTVTELAGRLDVTAAAVSKRAPWFQERGLITVGADALHARRVLLSLTPKGRRLVDAAGASLEEAFAAKFADISDVNLTELHLTLTRMLTHLTGTSIGETS